MILILCLFIVEAFAYHKHPLHRRLGSYDSYEWNPGTDVITLPEYNVTQFWWDKATSAPFNLQEKNKNALRTETTEFSPVGNMSLTQQQLEHLTKSIDDLPYIVEFQSRLVFNESKPELQALVQKWLVQLVNKTKGDKNFTITMNELLAVKQPRLHYEDEDYKHDANDYGGVDKSFRNILRDSPNGGAPPNYQMPPGYRGEPPRPEYNEEYGGVPPQYQRPNDKPGHEGFQIPPGFSGRGPPGLLNEGNSGYSELVPPPGSPVGLIKGPPPPGFYDPFSEARTSDNRPKFNDPDRNYPQGPFRSEIPSGYPGPPEGPNPQRPPGFNYFKSSAYPPAFQDFMQATQGYPSGFPMVPPGSERFSPGSQVFSPGSPDGLPDSPVFPGFQGVPSDLQRSPLEQNHGNGKPNLESIVQNPSMQKHSNPGRQMLEFPTSTPETFITSLPGADQIGGQNALDYHDMMNSPNPVDLLDLGNTPSTMSGLAISLAEYSITTTTPTPPLVEAMKLNMTKNIDNGYFNTFTLKLLEMLIAKKADIASRLFVATDMNLDEMDKEGLLHVLGTPFHQRLRLAGQVLAAMSPETVQYQAQSLREVIEARSERLNYDLNFILNSLDSLYLMPEGEALFASLVAFEEFPDSKPPAHTAFMVMKTMLSAVLAPCYRLKGTERLSVVLNKINVFIENSPLSADVIRRSYSNEYMNNQGRESIKDKDFKAKTKKKERKRLKNILLKEKLNPIARDTSKVDRKSDFKKDAQVGFIKKSRNKSKGLTIETDRDFTMKKHKYKMSDFKKHVKRKIKNHLKNKHHALYENYRNKHKKAKALAKKQEHDPKTSNYNYEKLQRNKKLHEDVKTGTIVKLGNTTSPLKKRFDVVDIFVDRQNINESEKNKKHESVIKADKNVKSKYLSKLNPKNKTIKGFEDSNSNEKNLKVNLQDTLRHGNRKFIERRNFKRYRKRLFELSSYSDEEGVLKNNIYKVFGYTQGRL